VPRHKPPMSETELQAEIQRFGRLYVASSHVSHAVVRSRSRQNCSMKWCASGGRRKVCHGAGFLGMTRRPKSWSQ